jgi:hypothetical protein
MKMSSAFTAVTEDMASPGELVYRQLVAKVTQKISTRFITGHDVQAIGRFYWPIMNEEYKSHLKEEHGRQAFWQFSQTLKYCFINNQYEVITELWQYFDQNGKNLVENFYENSLNKLASDVL